MMNRNRIRICGRNTTTAPTPASTPSLSSERNQPSGRAAASSACSAATPASIQPIGASAQLNTAWNMKNSTAASSRGPASGCSTTASMRCDQALALPVLVCTATESVRACFCRARTSLGRSCGRAGGVSPMRAASAAPSASRPRRRTATVSTTGRSSSAPRRAESMPMPSRAARSIMFSATTSGRPSAFSSSTKRRWLRRLVASTTATIASSGRSPAMRPKMASRVTASSGERGVRL